ncbi:MAG: VOC family protein [Acidobacteriota bacterium]|nr:MAG: VOC family protein [Acidobacteriota bacterium]
MKLGCFSVSLAVKDLQASKEFYEKLGFEKYHGDEDQGWLIMKNGSTNIGLFQGMFEGNILTFNPGWDQDAQNLEDFEDAREIHASLRENGVDAGDDIESESGPASFMITDPDGNTILIDQHV